MLSMDTTFGQGSGMAADVQGTSVDSPLQRSRHATYLAMQLHVLPME